MSVNIYKNGTLSVVSGRAADVEAKDVDYNPSSSGLSATKVQSAIDEIADDIGEINEELSDIDATLKMEGYTLPDSLKGMNYIDSNNVYHKRIARVKLSSLTFGTLPSDNTFIANAPSDSMSPIANGNKIGYCVGYKLYVGSYSSFSSQDKAFQISSTGVSSSKKIVFRDTSCSSLSDFNTLITNKDLYLYYELATEQTISVDGGEAISKINEELSDIDATLKMEGYTLPSQFVGMNYIDSNNVYHKKVGRIDLSTLSWKYSSIWYTDEFQSGIAVGTTADVVNPNIYCKGYEVGEISGVSGRINYWHSTYGLIKRLAMNNGSSTTKPSGYMYYVLATEQNVSVDGKEAISKINEELSTIPDKITGYKDAKIKAHSGKLLGTSFTSEQSSKIRGGDFSWCEIGDYWTIGGHNWRIWDIDWYLNKGDTSCSTHHLVIMPDDNLLDADGSSTHYMNDTNTTDGGYAGTKYRSTYKSQCESSVNSSFGSGHILSHRELLCNAVASGKTSGWAWYDCSVEIPSEVMMYGSTIWSNYTDGGSGYNVGTAYPQLALAYLDPSRVANRENYWLRDAASASWFAGVAYDGLAYRYGASAMGCGVRPYFLLY